MENKQKTDANYQLNPMLKLASEYASRFSITKNHEVAEAITKWVYLPSDCFVWSAMSHAACTWTCRRLC